MSNAAEAGPRWRRIYCNDWHTAELQSLSNDEKVVYFYARTGPQSTSPGIHRMSSAVAVEDIGNLTAIEFDLRLSAVCEAFSWRFDAPTRVLWIPTWLHENPPQSPNVCVAWRKLILNVPDCDLKYEAAAAIVAYLKDKPKAFLEAFGEDMPKDFRISKAKPKAKPKANQGAGVSGIQGSEKKRAGAATNGRSTNAPLDSPLLNVARLVRASVPIPADASDDELLDLFNDFAQRQNLTGWKNAEAVEAMKACA